MAVVGLVGLLVWCFFNSELMAVDSCLDAGGRWGEDKACQFETPKK